MQYAGLAIRTTADNYVLVKDVRPGGAIDRDGFIKVGIPDIVHTSRETHVMHWKLAQLGSL
jgi:hypothetical protein